MAETVYCDDYDAIKGTAVSATVQTKVVAAPESDKPQPAEIDVETKGTE